MIRNPLYLWTAAILLWVGVFGATGVIPQRRVALEAPLGTVVPNVWGSEEESFNLARSVAERLVPALEDALPS